MAQQSGAGSAAPLSAVCQQQGGGLCETLRLNCARQFHQKKKRKWFSRLSWLCQLAAQQVWFLKVSVDVDEES